MPPVHCFVNLEAFGKSYPGANYEENCLIQDAYLRWIPSVGAKKRPQSKRIASNHLRLEYEDSKRSVKPPNLFERMPSNLGSAVIWSSSGFQESCVICRTLKKTIKMKINTSDSTESTTEPDGPAFHKDVEQYHRMDLQPAILEPTQISSDTTEFKKESSSSPSTTGTKRIIKKGGLNDESHDSEVWGQMYPMASTTKLPSNYFQNSSPLVFAMTPSSPSMGKNTSQLGSPSSDSSTVRKKSFRWQFNDNKPDVETEEKRESLSKASDHNLSVTRNGSPRSLGHTMPEAINRSPMRAGNPSPPSKSTTLYKGTVSPLNEEEPEKLGAVRNSGSRVGVGGKTSTSFGARVRINNNQKKSGKSSDQRNSSDARSSDHDKLAETQFPPESKTIVRAQQQQDGGDGLSSDDLSHEVPMGLGAPSEPTSSVVKDMSRMENRDESQQGISHADISSHAARGPDARQGGHQLDYRNYHGPDFDIGSFHEEHVEDDLRKVVEDLASVVKNLASQVRANSEAISGLTTIAKTDHVSLLRINEQQDKLIRSISSALAERDRKR